MNRFEDQTLSHTQKERKILHDPTLSTFSNKFLDQIYRINSKNSILRLLFNKILVQTYLFYPRSSRETKDVLVRLLNI